MVNDVKNKALLLSWLHSFKHHWRSENAKKIDVLAYCGIEDFVLQNGVYFRPERLPRNWRLGARSECFANAYALTMSIAHTGLRYYEGFAVTEDECPTLHAWCVDGKGRLIDNTWEHLWRDEDEANPTAYLGVEIPRRILKVATDLHGYYGVLDDSKNDYPILRHKWNHNRAYKMYCALYRDKLKSDMQSVIALH